ncbi:DUF3817 domain-containing protein [Ohtaekwangia sp.]|uniref:DUF3817 domain-containing protein n=1 Tax=Ohtaekwangia sp. TaxID=2066019 RepID=UPI002F91C606
MTNLLSTTLGRLRVVAFLEGISFLVLLGIAMPLKYMASNPEPVRFVGMAHGVLFIAYVLLLIQTTIAYKWTVGKSALAFVASLLPFGTFIADKKLFRED